MKKNAQNTKTSSKKADETVEVLYQKMGERWFAFSMVDDEIFVGSISQEEIDAVEKARSGKKNAVYKISGNS